MARVRGTGCGRIGAHGHRVHELVTALRNLRNEKGIPFREASALYAPEIPAFIGVAQKLSILTEVERAAEKPREPLR